MIAAAHPLATEAGCEVLQNGGTAIDAAIATQMVLAVVEPQSSGLAGGTIITYYDNATQQVRFFEGLSKAPQQVTTDLKTPTEADIAACGVTRFRGRVNNTGRAFGVPGTVRVLEMVHNIYGNKLWNTLFETGIDIAESGFPMPEYMNTILGENATASIPRCKFPDLQARYCIDENTPKAVSTTLFNNEIAQTLRTVRDGGAAAFYDPQGSIVQSIIARVTAGPCTPVGEPAIIPSLMTAEDFSAYQAQERQPVCATHLGRTICSSAPPAFGDTALLYTLDLMSQGGIEIMTPKTLEWTHLFIESSRLAQIDRRQYIGDPDFNVVPVAGLLDSAYLQSRYALFSPTQALNPVEYGMPAGAPPMTPDSGSTEEDATSQVSIVDQYGNALSMTTSNNSSFGAQMEAAGMILNNVQNNFTRLDSISPGIPVNVMDSGKKPRTSMAPTIVLDSQNRVELVVGAAGGSGIPDYIAQTILGVFVYGYNPQKAMNQPHVSGQVITTISGDRTLRSEVETGTSVADLLDELIAMGHPGARTNKLRSGMAAVQVRYRNNGNVRWLKGAADPRRDGVAVGQ